MAKYNRMLFVDVELTCWEGEPPAGEQSELIAFGIVDLRTDDLAIRIVKGNHATILREPLVGRVAEELERVLCPSLRSVYVIQGVERFLGWLTSQYVAARRDAGSSRSAAG